MNIKIGRIELEDWVNITTGEPCRYSVDYRKSIDGCVVLWKYNEMWRPSFNHGLYFINDIFIKKYGMYIPGTDKIVKDKVDDFIKRISLLVPFA